MTRKNAYCDKVAQFTSAKLSYDPAIFSMPPGIDMITNGWDTLDLQILCAPLYWIRVIWVGFEFDNDLVIVCPQFGGNNFIGWLL